MPLPALSLSVLPLLLLLPAQPSAPGAQLLGDWTTPDDSVVRVYPCGEDLCLRLVEVGAKESERHDRNNPDTAQQSRPLCGLEIGHGFVPDGPGHAHDGHVYDPQDGKTYSSEMTVDGSTLKLRGYVGVPLFGRTEKWHRTSKPIPTCG